MYCTFKYFKYILFLIFLTENINDLESQDPTDLLLAQASLYKLLLGDLPVLILVHFSESRLGQQLLSLQVIYHQECQVRVL